jgi:Putative phage serine protease XkdF
MARLSTAPFDGDKARYTDEQWRKACVLDKGDLHLTPKQRFSVPVRDTDGTLNSWALSKAAETLASMDDAANVDAARRKLDKRYAKAGLPVSVRTPVEKTPLSTEARNDLPASAFVFPKERRYPIHDLSHARNALARASGKPEEGQVKAAVYRRYPELKKACLMTVVPLWKDDAKRIVYGVVLTPGLRDSQGDIVSPPEIEKAAHAFLTAYRKHDVQHSEQPAGVETVESFVAPQDMEIAGQNVIKGSWVMATHISDEDTWDRVRKGELTGYSIGGTGERLPEAA